MKTEPKTASHTPGPWMSGGQYGYSTTTTLAKMYCVSAKNGGASVAAALNKSDARLIAAAPELLSALESLLTGSEEQWVPHDLRLIEAQKAARAAIAKAKG